MEKTKKNCIQCNSENVHFTITTLIRNKDQTYSYCLPCMEKLFVLCPICKTTMLIDKRTNRHLNGYVSTPKNVILYCIKCHTEKVKTQKSHII